MRLGLVLLLALATPSRAAAPDWFRDAIGYEVFVRSFSDSNADGIGDLSGLLARLDHLNDGDPGTDRDLGVSLLWLMPVAEAASYHGYDVVDYDAVERDYGTREDLQRLIDAAHARGVRVIVDLVLNHTSSQHPWFREASAPGSALRDRYVWSASDPGWAQPWGGGASWHRGVGGFYYGVFDAGMPDLNYRSPGLREEVKRIAAAWLALGVDGFRLDAARYLVETGPGAGQQDTAETHAFWREFAAHVHAAKPDAVLVGEVWADAGTIAGYLGEGELDAAFDFPLAEAVVRGVGTGQVAGILGALMVGAATGPLAQRAPFLTNHDQVRVATQLGSDAGRLRSAAAVLLTLPGTPFLYYGEELGMQNGSGAGDEWKRTPLPWDASGGFTAGVPWMAFAPGKESANVASEQADPGSLLARYRALVRVRLGSLALRRGSARAPEGTASPQVLALLRGIEGERVLVVHNLSSAAATAGPWALGASGFERLFADPGVGDPEDPAAARITLPAYSTGIWRLR